MNRLNSDRLFTELRKSGRNATYTLRVEPEPENRVEKALTVGFSVVDGEIGEVWTNERRTTQFTDLVISGKYGVWVDLIRNRTSITDAFLSKKLSLGGETNQIYGPTVWMSPERLFAVALSPAAERIIEIARTIPTEFHGKYAPETV